MNMVKPAQRATTWLAVALVVLLVAAVTPQQPISTEVFLKTAPIQGPARR